MSGNIAYYLCMATLIIGLMLFFGLLLAVVRICASALGLYWQGVVVGMAAVMLPEGLLKLARHARIPDGGAS